MAILKPTNELANDFGSLHAYKKALEADLAKVIQQMAYLEAELLQRFADEEITQVRTLNYGLVYLQKELWAKCDNPKALTNTEWAWLIKTTINSQSISAAVRELPLDEHGNRLYPSKSIEDVVQIREGYRVRVKKS